MAVARVAARVIQGGHNVPEETILRRFKAGLENLDGLYKPPLLQHILRNRKSRYQQKLCNTTKGFLHWQRVSEMSRTDISALDRTLAKVCELCPVCLHARHHQKGVVYDFVKGIETDICPFCKAYERVHGKKAHEKRG